MDIEKLLQENGDESSQYYNYQDQSFPSDSLVGQLVSMAKELQQAGADDRRLSIIEKLLTYDVTPSAIGK